VNWTLDTNALLMYTYHVDTDTWYSVDPMTTYPAGGTVRGRQVVYDPVSATLLAMGPKESATPCPVFVYRYGEAPGVGSIPLAPTNFRIIS